MEHFADQLLYPCKAFVVFRRIKARTQVKPTGKARAQLGSEREMRRKMGGELARTKSRFRQIQYCNGAWGPHHSVSQRIGWTLFVIGNANAATVYLRRTMSE